VLVLVALACAGAVGYYAAGWPSSAGGSCEHLVSTVRTSEPSYAPGQTVVITVTVANEGPACTTPGQCVPPPAASAYNSAGNDVWDYGASTFTGVPTCISTWVPQAWPAHYSDTQVVDWSQDKCGAGPWGEANPNCPDTPVPAGQYRIVGGTGTSVSATITISG
jgi:hypothetical protein